MQRPLQQPQICSPSSRACVTVSKELREIRFTLATRFPALVSNLFVLRLRLSGHFCFVKQIQLQLTWVRLLAGSTETLLPSKPELFVVPVELADNSAFCFSAEHFTAGVVPG
ncbi:hypothetical protein MHB49_18180 [Paenibacillus sp. FSL K6-0108]